MKVRKSILTKLVREEAKKLKHKAFKSELERLDFNNLNPHSPTRCVYGQMTGECFTPRATKLIKECTVRIYDGGGVDSVKLNGELKERGSVWSNRHWSPIEVFIYLNRNNGNNKILIDYLQGKTKRLNFKPF